MTDIVYLDGKLKWCRPHQTNEWGKYSTKLYPTAESLEKFKALEVMNVIGKDEDGYHVTLNCPRTKDYKGVITSYKVDVIDKEGRPFLEPIGNGSDGTVKLEHYSFPVPGSKGMRKKAIRWTGLRVNHHVPYTAADRTVKEEEKIGELANQPRPF